MRRTDLGLVAAGSLLLAACGGTTRHSAGEKQAEGGAEAAGGAVAASGGQGAASAVDPGLESPTTQLDDFESSSPLGTLGLWMGFDGNQLPVESPPVPHDGLALHLFGVTEEAGLDVFFHTPLPAESIWRSVSFWSQSELPSAALTVAVAGPEPLYFEDRAQGITWPKQVVQLSNEWQQTVVNFAELGIGPDRRSPHSEMFGAVHFIIEPHTTYDLWIDDFSGDRLYSGG